MKRSRETEYPVKEKRALVTLNLGGTDINMGKYLKTNIGQLKKLKITKVQAEDIKDSTEIVGEFSNDTECDTIILLIIFEQR